MSYQQEQPTCTVAAMCQQESTSYKVEDYLNQRRGASSPLSVLETLFQSTNNKNNNTTSTMTQEDIQVCINNRSKMASWCMTLMDACQLNRETVSIAMNYLDRFLATSAGQDCIEDSAAFQLACMTALYSAIKIHEEKAISPEVLSTISRGFYTKADMEQMEWKMLMALNWRVNVPTPLAFVREFLAMLPPSQQIDEETKNQLISLCSVQTELCVANYDFVTIKPSSIGFASLVNAMDVLGLDVTMTTNSIINHGLIDTNEVFRIQSTLYATVANFTHLRRAVPPPQPQVVAKSEQQRNTTPLKRRSSHTTSPRAVCEH